MKNLGYKQTEGRKTVVHTLKLLIEKFPTEIIEVYGELLFFTLLLRLVNDDNAECRKDVQGAIRSLVFSKKVSQAKIKTMLNTVLKMGS